MSTPSREQQRSSTDAATPSLPGRVLSGLSSIASLVVGAPSLLWSAPRAGATPGSPSTADGQWETSSASSAEDDAPRDRDERVMVHTSAFASRALTTSEQRMRFVVDSFRLLCEDLNDLHGQLIGIHADLDDNGGGTLHARSDFARYLRALRHLREPTGTPPDLGGAFVPGYLTGYAVYLVGRKWTDDACWTVALGRLRQPLTEESATRVWGADGLVILREFAHVVCETPARRLFRPAPPALPSPLSADGEWLALCDADGTASEYDASGEE